jgi:hypothetical protein
MNANEAAAAERAGVDPVLADDVAGLIYRIEVNYSREGAFPGSRFEGQRLEFVQAWAVIRHVKDALAVSDVL